MATNSLKSTLEAHPRLIGMLFALVLFTAQAGSAAAGLAAYHGP